MTKEDIRTELEALFNDPGMITESFYSPLAVEYADNKFPFVEYHIMHLLSHKLTNPETYISNLKLMIKKR